jgi:rare lipoprotein A
MRRLPLALLVVWFTMSCSGLDRSQKGRAGRSDLPEPVPTTYYTEQGIASWYGKEFHEKPTATGEVYDMYAMTAAHKTLPLGTWVVVTDLGTQRSVRVRINDRGPFVKDRIIDLSYGAADELGMMEKGTTLVEVRCSYSEKTLRENLGYWVQLGAYQDSDLAGDLAVHLGEEYPNVRVLSSQAYHHVRIGPFQSEAEATQLKELLLARGQRAFVVRDLLSLPRP